MRPFTSVGEIPSSNALLEERDTSRNSGCLPRKHWRRHWSTRCSGAALRMPPAQSWRQQAASGWLTSTIPVRCPTPSTTTFPTMPRLPSLVSAALSTEPLFSVPVEKPSGPGCCNSTTSLSASPSGLMLPISKRAWLQLVFFSQDSSPSLKQPAWLFRGYRWRWS